MLPYVSGALIARVNLDRRGLTCCEPEFATFSAYCNSPSRGWRSLASEPHKRNRHLSLSLYSPVRTRSSRRKFPRSIPQTFSVAQGEICRRRCNGAAPPAGTKSFVVTLFDPDEHADPSGWWHWIVYNLPASVDKLPKGAGTEHSTVLPPGTMQRRTDLGNDAYHGPCPDKGDPPHRSTFTVYALSVDKLDVPADSTARWWYRLPANTCWGRQSSSRTTGVKRPNTVI
jgi:Raf kinase inhibitor-like YbhB/YbcL family protein